MDLKGYRLWAMGQLDSNVQSPTGCACTSARAVPVVTSTSHALPAAA
jgi:hypothetical protein